MLRQQIVKALTAVILSILAGAQTSAAAEKQHVATIAGYDISAYKPENGTSFCTAVKRRSGTDVSFSIPAGNMLNIGLFNDTWSFNREKTVNARIRVDGRYSKRVRAQVEDGAVTMTVKPLRPALNALRRGYELVVAGPSGDLTFSLDGTARALKRLEECRDRRIAKANPFSSHNGSSDSTNGQGFVHTVDGLLKKAGLPNATPYREDSRIKWAVDGGLSGTVFLGEHKGSMESLLLDLERKISQGCQKGGSTEVRRRTDTANGWLVEGQIICYDNGQENPFEFVMHLGDDDHIYRTILHYGATPTARRKAAAVTGRLYDLLDGADR